jgi:hypothetical protein
VLPGRQRRAGFPCGGDGKPKCEPLERGHRRDQLHGDDGAERDVGRQLAHALHRLVPDDRNGDPMVFELVAQLTVRVQRIVFHDDGTGSQHGMEGDDVLRAIRQDQGCPVSGLDTGLPEAGRGPAVQRFQLVLTATRPEDSNAVLDPKRWTEDSRRSTSEPLGSFRSAGTPSP